MDRRPSKPELCVPMHAAIECLASGEVVSSWIVRMSVAGVDLETLQPFGVGREVMVRVKFAPGSFALPGVVRASAAASMTVQFGLLGVHETRAVLEVVRSGGIEWVEPDAWLAEMDAR
jgi:hypothetical protein